MDETGDVVRVEGTLARDAEGCLVVRSWTRHVGGKPTETRVPRDATVDVIEADVDARPSPRGGRGREWTWREIEQGIQDVWASFEF